MGALRIERLDPGHARLAGRLGFAEAGAALARGDAIYKGASGEVSVDASGLEAVDSATLALLLAWSARARHAGITLRLHAVPPGLDALARLCDAGPLLGLDATTTPTLPLR
jgi:phospholipid transport system transporter-binding protein